MILDRDKARTITDRLLKLSNADETTVSIHASSSLNVRFALNDVTTNGESSRLNVAVTASFGNRSATVEVNQTDDETLRQAVANAETMARLAPENPEHMPVPEPVKIAEPVTYAESTAQAGPKDVANWLRPVVEHSRSKGVSSAGFLEKHNRTSTLANSSGVFIHQPATNLGFSMTARAADGGGSGWASCEVTDVANLDLTAVGASAVDKALRSRNPEQLAPGRRTVLLEPAAVRELISLLVWNLGRREFDENRSFLNQLAKNADPVGEDLFGDKATILSDPSNPAAPCSTHNSGIPLKKTLWVEGGTLKNLQVGRFWARNAGIPNLPSPGNVIMPGEGKSMKDLLKVVDDGVLVTRLWYIRGVQPQSLLYTGLTRDGTFRIKNGEVVAPVKNFRFNESPVNLLRNLMASGVPARALSGEWGMPMSVPPLVVRDFNLASVSDAS